MSVNESISAVTHNFINLSLDTVPTFDGSTKVSEFLDSLNAAASLGSWSENQKLTVAKLKLRGSAKDFLNSEPQLKESQTTWEQFTAALKDRYKKKKSRLTLQQELAQCQQRNNETIKEYVVRLKIAANKTIEYGSDTARNAFLKEQLRQDTLEHFMNGLAMPVQQRVMSARPATLDRAIELAIEEEDIEIKLHKNSKLKVRTTELAPASTSSEQQSAERQTQGTHTQYQPWQHRPATQTRRRIVCYGCGGEGHFQRECRRMICDRCKRPGHSANRCHLN